MSEEKKIIRDAQTDKRIHEHLRNESDLISDEDINNVKTSIDEEAPVGLTKEKAKFPEEEQGETKDNIKKDDGEEPRIETSWNILK